jgi:hypothetical protein
MEFKISTPAQIYINWECDIVCPVDSIINSGHGDYRDEFTLEQIQADYRCKYPKMRGIALDSTMSNLSWWLIELIVLGRLNLNEVILYTEPEDILRKYQVEKPVYLSFTAIYQDSEVESDNKEGEREITDGEPEEEALRARMLEEAIAERCDIAEAAGLRWTAPTVKLMYMTVRQI